MARPPRDRIAIYCLGLTVLIAWVLIAALSGQFVFGEGHESRPILTFLGFYGIAWIAFALAVILIAHGSRPGAMFIIVVAIAMRLALLGSNPIQENDGYRYILDGAVLSAGGNPFSHAPEAMLDHAPYPVWQDLQKNPTARESYDRISYKYIPTIYPPVAQFTFALGHLVAPWIYAGQRMGFLLWDFATIAVILLVLRAQTIPIAWSVVYAWNPLIIKEIANSAHSDAAVAFFFVAMIGAFGMVQSRSGIRWVIVAGVCFAGAVLARLYPLMIAPVCLAIVYRFAGVRGIGWFGASSAAAIFIAYLPFLTVPLDQLFEGLSMYSAHWRRNDGAYGIIAWLSPQARLISNGTTVLASVVAAIWIVRKRAALVQCVAAIQVVLLVWILFAPAVFPWYAVGLIAVSVFRPKAWVVVMSGSLGAYYLLFLYSYREYGEYWPLVTRAIEHGVIWIAFAAPLLAATAASTAAATSTTTGRTAASAATATREEG